MSGNNVVSYFDYVSDEDKNSVIELIEDFLKDKKMNLVVKYISRDIEHTIINNSGEEIIVKYEGILHFIDLFMKLYGKYELFAILNNIFNKAFHVADKALKELLKLKNVIENDGESYDENDGESYDNRNLERIEDDYEDNVIGVLNNITSLPDKVEIMKISGKNVISLKDLKTRIEDIKSSITVDGQFYKHSRDFSKYINNIKELYENNYNEEKYNYIEDVKNLINMIVKSLIILDKIYLFFKEIEKNVSQIEYDARPLGGFRKKNNLKPTVIQSKEILGKIRRIYKVAGSRKEHIKYKGELISVSDYKKLVKQAKALKSQNKPVTKPKAKPTAKSATKPKAKPSAKPAPKPKAKSTTKSATKSKAK